MMFYILISKLNYFIFEKWFKLRLKLRQIFTEAEPKPKSKKWPELAEDEAKASVDLYPPFAHKLPKCLSEGMNMMASEL